MSDEDYRKGSTGLPGGSVKDYMNGIEDRERIRRERQSKSDPPAPLNLSAGQTGTTLFPPKQPERWPQSHSSTPDALSFMTQGCAGLFVVLFVGYTLSTSAAWTWPYMIGCSLCAAVAGLIAGALLFMAMRALAAAARAVGAVLITGAVLDFLDVISLPPILAPMLHAFGF